LKESGKGAFFSPLALVVQVIEAPFHCLAAVIEGHRCGRSEVQAAFDVGKSAFFLVVNEFVNGGFKSSVGQPCYQNFVTLFQRRTLLCASLAPKMLHCCNLFPFHNRFLRFS